MLVLLLVSTLLLGSVDVNGVELLANPNGEVVMLENNWHVTQEGPWFVMYSTPWCKFCHFMYPEWVKMAQALKGVMNVGKINCQEDKPSCVKQSVSSYPQLHYLKDGAKRRHYHHDRIAGIMAAFARRQVEVDYPNIIQAHASWLAEKNSPDLVQEAKKAAEAKLAAEEEREREEEEREREEMAKRQQVLTERARRRSSTEQEGERKNNETMEQQKEDDDEGALIDGKVWQRRHGGLARPRIATVEAVSKGKYSDGLLHVDGPEHVDDLVDKGYGVLVLHYHRGCAVCRDALQAVQQATQVLWSDIVVAAIGLGEHSMGDDTTDDAVGVSGRTPGDESHRDAAALVQARFQHASVPVFPLLRFHFRQDVFTFRDRFEATAVHRFARHMINPFDRESKETHSREGSSSGADETLPTHHDTEGRLSLPDLRRDTQFSHFVLLLPSGEHAHERHGHTYKMVSQLAREYGLVAPFHISHDPGHFVSVAELSKSSPALNATSLPLFTPVVAVLHDNEVHHLMLTGEQAHLDLEERLLVHLLPSTPLLTPWSWRFVVEQPQSETIVVGVQSSRVQRASRLMLNNLASSAHRDMHAYSPPRLRFASLDAVAWPEVAHALWHLSEVSEPQLVAWSPGRGVFVHAHDVAKDLHQGRVVVTEARSVQLFVDRVLDADLPWRVSPNRDRRHLHTVMVVCGLLFGVAILFVVVRCLFRPQRKRTRRWTDSA